LSSFGKPERKVKEDRADSTGRLVLKAKEGGGANREKPLTTIFEQLHIFGKKWRKKAGGKRERTGKKQGKDLRGREQERIC